MKYQLLQVPRAESASAATAQEPDQDPSPVAPSTTSPTYATVKEVIAEVIAEVISDRPAVDTLEAEAPAEVAENIDLGFQVANEQQGRTPATSATTAADSRPFQTSYGIFL